MRSPRRAPWKRRLSRPRRRRCGRAVAREDEDAGSAAGRPPRPPPGSSPREALSGERFLGGVPAEPVELRIGLAEGLLDLGGGHVREAAALAQVFHVAALILVEGMEDR